MSGALNIMPRIAETPSSRPGSHREAAAAVEKSGYFGETAKYVLPTLNSDVDKSYESGRLMKLDQRSYVGLKAQINQRSKTGARKDSQFAKELTISFTNFEKIIEHKSRKSRKVTSAQRGARPSESVNSEKSPISLDLLASGPIAFKSSLDNLMSCRNALTSRRRLHGSSRPRPSARASRKTSDAAEGRLPTPSDRFRVTVKKISPLLAFSGNARKDRKSSFTSSSLIDHSAMSGEHGVVSGDSRAALQPRQRQQNKLTRSITMANLPEMLLDVEDPIRFKRFGEVRSKRCCKVDHA